MLAAVVVSVAFQAIAFQIAPQELKQGLIVPGSPALSDILFIKGEGILELL